MLAQEPTPTPPPVQVIAEPGESWHDLAIAADCQTASVSCTGGEASIYVNGAFLGECGSTLADFYTRGPFSSTLTLYNPGETLTLTLEIDCGTFYQQGATLPTPTPWVMHPPTQTYEIPGESGIMGGGIGGGLPLPNFYAGVDTWLGIGKDTVSLVNGGNLLYVIAAIGVAGMVLGWAIEKIKHPERG